MFKRGRNEPLSDETITQRLMLIQCLAALRLSGGSADHASDLDREAREGWGYPESLGGPIAQVDRVGQAAFEAACHALAERFGERFQAPDLDSNRQG